MGVQGGRLPGVERSRMRSNRLINREGDSFGNDKNRGDVCTTLRVYKRPLNCSLGNATLSAVPIVAQRVKDLTLSL